MRDTANSSGIGLFAVIQSMASSKGLEVMPLDARDAAEIERSVAAFAGKPNGGLIIAGGGRY